MTNKKIHPLILQLSSVRKEIKYAFLISAFSISTIEFILKSVPAPAQIIFKVGEIYLRICYSVFAASIFFYLNQHIPKEEKKIRTFRYINNKVAVLGEEVQHLLSNLKLSVDINHYHEATREMIEEACAKINPKTPVFSPNEHAMPFTNWHTYANFKYKKMRALIEELLILNESMDVDLLERVLIIEDTLYNHFHLDERRYTGPDLKFLARPIFDLNKEVFKAYKIKSNKYNKYWHEYSKRFKADMND